MELRSEKRIVNGIRRTATIAAPAVHEQPSSERLHNATTKLFLNTVGCEAQAYASPTGVTILAGSVGRAEHASYVSKAVVKRRTELLSNGVTEIRGGSLIFISDYECSSPSMAGELLRGANTNGRTAWRSADGLTYQQLEDSGQLY